MAENLKSVNKLYQEEKEHGGIVTLDTCAQRQSVTTSRKEKILQTKKTTANKQKRNNNQATALN